MALADQEEIDGAGVDSRGHLEIHPSDRRLLVGRGAQGRAHLERRAGGLYGVIVAFEEQEQSVPAELEHRASPAVDDVQHPAENAAEHSSELLGPDPASGRQALGETGESRDVDEEKGPHGLDPAFGPATELPIERDAGHIALEAVYLGKHVSLLMCRVPRPAWDDRLIGVGHGILRRAT